jgi:hypothetical protein
MNGEFPLAKALQIAIHQGQHQEIPGTAYLSLTFGPGFLGLSFRSSSFSNP